MSKNIFIVHGYLLCGTGSNIYSCNLAMQWKKQGHAITIFCQDPKAGSYDWVDEFFGAEDVLPEEPTKPGTVRVLVPDIAGLLPVYVYDEYDGYTTKTIPNCTDEEIECHIAMTSSAIRKAIDLWGCDKVLANHALLSPVNTKRALEGTNVPFDIKIHGSGLTFVVKPHPKYMEYAIEGIEKCNKIIAGTHHIVQQVKETFASESEKLNLEEKLVIIPPGMDPSVFSLSESNDSSLQAFLTAIKEHITKEGNGRVADAVSLNDATKNILSSDGDPHKVLVNLGKTYNQRVVDADLPSRFPKISEEEPVIIYFGKFLNTKGVAEILLSFPRIVEKIPKIRFIFVGFGTFREHLETMILALQTGDIELLKAAAQSPDENNKGFLESSVDINAYFRKITPNEAARITVTGCLNHTELGLLLPIASVSVVASKANEAFGMVSVEAMSAGVMPLCVYHSGLIDVFNELKTSEPLLESLMHADVAHGGDFDAMDGANFMEVFPEKLYATLEYLYPSKNGGLSNQIKRKDVARRLRAVAESTWSWDGICKRIAEL